MATPAERRESGVAEMKFAKRVFMCAGIWGLLVVPPLFFLLDIVNRQTPPAVTHLEFYYGFTAVTTVWQVAFLVIASDPVRFRPLMPVAFLEKAGWIGTLVVLYAQGQVSASIFPFGAVDSLLGLLFAIAFVRTGTGSVADGPWSPAAFSRAK
jgi:hypothetical protein